MVLPVSSLRLLDELNGAYAEVGFSAAALYLDPLPDDAGEPPVENPRAPARVVTGHVEPDPADDVVGQVRSLALDGVVDREQELRARAGGERVLHRVELRSGVGVVVLVDRHPAVEAGHHPLLERVRVDPAARAVEVEQAERSST